MTSTISKPCWQCGTRHESDAMPALCSDPCREAWRERYHLAYGTPAEPDDEAPRLWCRDCCARVPADHMHDWSAKSIGEQQTGNLAEARARRPQITAAWREALRDEPRPADEPQPLVGDGQAAVKLPSERTGLLDAERIARHLGEKRPSWWRRWLPW